jgi:hypothetical protein
VNICEKGIVCCIVFFLLSFSNTCLLAQEKIITAGFQFKPIFSSDFFNTGPQNQVNNGVDFTIKPKSGYCAGMVIRKGITNTVSMETGINFVKRNYALTIKNSELNETTDFGIVSYEIPLQGLVFIQLSDYIFMDVALGLSLDFYPSDIRTNDSYFEHYSARRSWFAPSVLANVGWEYRTEKSGYFYLGASYHKPFNYTFYSYLLYPERAVPTAQAEMKLQGNYLTADIRYFFPASPERKKKIRKADRRTK